LNKYIQREKSGIKELINLAKNTGDGYRKGAVRDRSQVYNPKTDAWVKRGDDGHFMDMKTSDNKPFKGVRKEK
jgi:hypothetical protein